MKAWNEFHGGAIWMFQDQGIKRKAADVGEKERRESCWKDEGTIWDSHGIAGSDGLVYSDRTPQTGWYQVCAMFDDSRRDAERQRMRSVAYALCGLSLSAPLREIKQPALQLRFDRRMTITKRTAMESGESSRKKRIGYFTVRGERIGDELVSTNRYVALGVRFFHARQRGVCGTWYLLGHGIWFRGMYLR